MPEKEPLEETLRKFNRPSSDDGEDTGAISKEMSELLASLNADSQPDNNNNEEVTLTRERWFKRLQELFPRAIEIKGGDYIIHETITLPQGLNFLPPANYRLMPHVKILLEGDSQDSLIINPGSTFYFGTNSAIYILGGNLYAAGKRGQEIKFISSEKGAVGTIIIQNSLESILNHCIIEGLVGEGLALDPVKGTGPLILRWSDVILSHCKINDNKATDNGTRLRHGSGVYIAGGSVDFRNCQITGNTAVYGGGVYIAGDSVNFRYCKITGNTAQNGGGVYIAGGSVDIHNSEISGNTSTQCFYDPGCGGIEIIGGSANFYNCMILGNTSDKIGGVYASEDGVFRFIGTCINNNRGGEGVGGILVNSTRTSFEHCEIEGNIGKLVGGILVQEGALASLDEWCSVKNNSRPQLYSCNDSNLVHSPSIIKDRSLIERVRAFLGI